MCSLFYAEILNLDSDLQINTTGVCITPMVKGSMLTLRSGQKELQVAHSFSDRSKLGRTPKHMLLTTQSLSCGCCSTLMVAPERSTEVCSSPELVLREADLVLWVAWPPFSKHPQFRLPPKTAAASGITPYRQRGTKRLP